MFLYAWTHLLELSSSPLPYTCWIYDHTHAWSFAYDRADQLQLLRPFLLGARRET